jgi:hypothetical protein
MNASHFNMRVRACALALLFLPHGAWAGKLTISPAAGNVTAILERDAAIYVDATRGVLVNEVPGIANQGRVMARLRSKTLGATIARIEYTYNMGEGTQTRVYHARSGYSIRKAIDRVNTGSGGSSEPNDSTAAGSEFGNEDAAAPADDIARDAAEAIYYPPDTATDVRAPNLPQETSVLEARVVDDFDHARDAELKALRKIEADINAGIVNRGGTITGYVSKAVCASCKKVIDTFAETFDAKGAIYEMIEPDPKQTVFRENLRGMSQKSSAELRAARSRYTKERLGTRNVTAPRIGAWEEPVSALRLEEEEAGLAVSEAPECVE